MRFLTDGCVGRWLAQWLSENGQDVVEADMLGPDPEDMALLQLAVSSNRILITLDTDFGELIFRRGQGHAGLVRIPEVPVDQRIALLDEIIHRYEATLEGRAIITIKCGRVRISRLPVD